MVEDLFHGAAGEVDPAVWKSFGDEMAAGVFGVDEVEIGDVVDDAAVDLFGDVEVVAAVAGLHVENRDVHALGHVGGEAGVGVAENEQGIGLFEFEKLLGFFQDVADGFAKRGGAGVHEVVGFAEPEIVPEDLVEFVVVVLAGVGDHLGEVFVEAGHGAGEADDFGACADDGEDFHLWIVNRTLMTLI